MIDGKVFKGITQFLKACSTASKHRTFKGKANTLLDKCCERWIKGIPRMNPYSRGKSDKLPSMSGLLKCFPVHLGHIFLSGK